MEFHDRINITFKEPANSSENDVDSFIESITNVFKYSPSLVVFLLTVNLVEIVFTILGNVTVILTVVAYRQLWVPTNILVSSLAVADFIIGVIMQTTNAWGLLNTLLQGKRHCSFQCTNFMRIMGFVIVTASLAHLSLITVDKFAAIVYPLRYVTIITMSRIKKTLMFVWMTSFVLGTLAAIPLPFSNGARGLWFLLVLLTCGLMICLHGKLFCISRKHARRIRNEIQSVKPGAEIKEERRGLMTVAMITVAMVISYVPFALLGVDEIFVLGEKETAKLFRDIMKQFAIILVLFNSVLNPLVYFFRSKKLRTYSRKLTKSIFTRIQEWVCT